MQTTTPENVKVFRTKLFWTGPYALLVGSWLGLVVWLDHHALFQYVTYLPVILGSLGIAALGHVVTWNKPPRALIRWKLVVVLWIGVAALPVLPTSRCKAFYLASWIVWPGTTAAFADRVLGGFDLAPLYRASEDVLSYRCVCDPATVDYVMITLAHGRVVSAMHLLD
jgi:hypothetical protein